MPFVLLTAERDPKRRKKKNREAKLSFDPGGEYIISMWRLKNTVWEY